MMSRVCIALVVCGLFASARAATLDLENARIMSEAEAENNFDWEKLLNEFVAAWSAPSRVTPPPAPPSRPPPPAPTLPTTPPPPAPVTTNPGSLPAASLASGSGSSPSTGGSYSGPFGFELRQAENMKNHRTNKYRGTDGKPITDVMILRRLHPFTIDVRGRAPDPTWTYNLELIESKIYTKPKISSIVTSPSKATKLQTQVDKGSVVCFHSTGEIGAFKLIVRDSRNKEIWTAPMMFVFVSNPYSEKDQTFITQQRSGEQAKGGPSVAEHVENEAGTVWQGSAESPSWIPWAFNQYEWLSVSTTTDMLVGLSMAQRAQTELIARWLSYQTGNVLHGRWDGNYKDGTEPWIWTSSTQILLQYQKTSSAVKYGQCWVFACLLTTLSRSIGIPTRPVTNFDSAHERRDAKGKYTQMCNMHWRVKTDGSTESADGENNASVWNFHVWVESEMTRPDIGNPSYNGWQAYDATPQEYSRDGPQSPPFSSDPNPYMCGPAPLNAMRSLEYKQPSYDPKKYDMGFIGGETNCQVNYFKESPPGSGKFKPSRTYTNYIGQKTLTKTPDASCAGEVIGSNGAYTRVCSTNVAGLYAPRGGSSFIETAEISNTVFIERNASFGGQQQQQRAIPDQKQRQVAQVGDNGGGRKRRTIQKQDLEKRPFSTVFTAVYKDDVRLGKPFKMFLQPTQGALREQVRVEEWSITVDAVSYRGDFIRKVTAVSEKNKMITGNSIRNNRLTLDFNLTAWRALVPVLKETQYLRVSMYASSDKYPESFLFSKIFAIKFPQLRMYCGAKERKIGDTVDCTVVFNNPLGVPLTKPVVQLVHSGASAKSEDMALKAQPQLQQQQSMNIAQASTSGNAELTGQSQQFASEWFSSKSNQDLAPQVDMQSKGSEGSQQQQAARFESSEAVEQSQQDIDKVDKATVVKMLKNTAIHIFKNVKVQLVGASGRQSLMATLTSQELHNIKGQEIVNIQAN